MRTALIVAALLLSPHAAHAWGQEGHRVIGTIADKYLTPSARAGVMRILPAGESIAEASTWPDFMRSDPSAFWQKDASPFHYVTVPPGKTYAEVGAPPEGDAVTALKHFAATVRDPRAKPADKALALRFIIHIVGDLHQPFHAGNGSDKGGNDVKIRFNGRETNLHALWDSGLVEDEGLSFSEKAAWLGAKLTPDELTQWDVADPLVWIGESAALRDGLYPEGEQVGFAYVYRHRATVDRRLAQGGVRLAAYLNWLFAPPK
ncbi:MAG: S1/P1 nuclease [Sphingomonadaceae bacterium]|nr:S1/P1 nuclease [Sphingomonadaceae bacterium]